MTADSSAVLRGRVVIVTGGSSGIGHATSLALAACGCHVVIVARDLARLARTAEEARQRSPVGNEAVPVRADVTSDADVQRMATDTVARFGRIDALVACAGVGGGTDTAHTIARPVVKLATGEWDRVIGVNLTGTYLTNRAVLPAMIAVHRGDIINVSSARGAARGQAFAAAYCASKRAVVGMSQALAREVAPLGVRVQVLLPDVTRTPLLERTTITARLGALLAPERVATTIVTMLALPEDTVLDEALVAPHAQSNAAWRTS
jgi:3-oxoacyl-[acyl-carrier protein] reductase